MDRSVRIAFLSALQRREVALWLGPSWGLPASPDEARLFGEQDWLGIWFEPQSAETAKAFGVRREEVDMQRRLMEVPGAIDDILQPDFRWSDYCPFFYLNGRSPRAVDESQAKRMLARLTKLEQLERIEHAVLAASGFVSPDELASAVKNAVGDFVGHLEFVIVLGVDDPDGWRDALKPSLATGLKCEILLVAESLGEVLAEFQEAQKPGVLPPGKSIWTRGGIRIPLDALVQTDPPIDQFFYVLTEEDINVPSDREDKRQLIRELLANQRPCWRALAHTLEWQRPTYGSAGERVSRILDELERAKGEPGEVECFDILGEPCSGLSVFLQWLAFQAARKGYPTLLARETYQPISYRVLRRFLVELDRFLVEKNASRLPVVVVLDDDVFTWDTSEQMATLARLLRRDARKVLLIRGVHEENEKTLSDFKRATAITSYLTENEQRSLQDWARTASALTARDSMDGVVDTIRDWRQEEQPIPLLVALDYVLTDDLRNAGDFAWHLERRFITALPVYSDQSASVASPSGHVFHLKDGAVSISLCEQSFRNPPPTRVQLAETLMTISAMGKFGVAVPRQILETMVQGDTRSVWQIMNILEKSRLVKAGITESHARAMPRPYYSGTEALGLSHDLYADMLMDSLASGQLGRELEITLSRLCEEFLEARGETKPGDLLALPLLRPLCKRLRPGDKDHVRYAEFLSMQYMRISYDEETSDRTKQLRQRVEELLSLYETIPISMIEDSPTLLHSLALNLRWRIPLRPSQLKQFSITECRNTFNRASRALTTAIGLSAERMESESQANLNTSLGLVYRNRSIVEMNHHDGEQPEWAKYLGDAKRCFRDVLDHTGNTYAAHALADLTIRELEVHTRRCGSPGYEDVPPHRLTWFPTLEPAAIAERLTNAFLLLSADPDRKFISIWNDTKKRAFELLAEHQADEAIAHLKQQRDEMGYVLRAIRYLRDFRVPDTPTEDEEQLSGLANAGRELEVAQQQGIAPCALGDLLRYAIFSAQKERLPHRPDYDPAYATRYQLIKKLKKDDGTLCYSDPAWLYDYAMLAFQNGEVREGQKMFRELRKTNLFRQVSLERSVLWMEAPGFKRCVEGVLRISQLDHRRDQGWGILATKWHRLDDLVPFKISSFLAFSPADQIQAGKTVRCRVRLQPAGTYAIPHRG